MLHTRVQSTHLSQGTWPVSCAVGLCRRRASREAAQPAGCSRRRAAGARAVHVTCALLESPALCLGVPSGALSSRAPNGKTEHCESEVGTGGSQGIEGEQARALQAMCYADGAKSRAVQGPCCQAAQLPLRNLQSAISRRSVLLFSRLVMPQRPPWSSLNTVTFTHPPTPCPPSPLRPCRAPIARLCPPPNISYFFLAVRNLIVSPLTKIPFPCFVA
jgi:hypothetical protein